MDSWVNDNESNCDYSSALLGIVIIKAKKNLKKKINFS